MGDGPVGRLYGEWGLEADRRCRVMGNQGETQKGPCHGGQGLRRGGRAYANPQAAVIGGGEPIGLMLIGAKGWTRGACIW